MNYFQDKLKTLIERAGGEVDGIFVTKPGVAILAKTTLTALADELFTEMNIDTNEKEYGQLAEFNSRVTYLSFKKEKGSSKEFNRKMVDDFQHLSVHASTSVTFLLAGISMETVLELVSHNAQVSRLTSSKTNAMNQPLFRIQGSEAEKQKELIAKITALVENEQGNMDKEFLNMIYPGSKALAITYTMTLREFHSMFFGRLSEDVETEMQEVCQMMCGILHKECPILIKEASWYYSKNVGERYKGN